MPSTRLTAAFRFLPILMIGCIGCTGLKKIQATDPLLVENRVVIVDQRKHTQQASRRVKSGLSPRPNRQFLWMRLGLARYSMIGDSARKKNFWKKWTTEPILISSANPSAVAKSVESKLFHDGYFRNHITYDTIRKGKKKVSLVYNVNLGHQFRIGEVSFPDYSDSLSLKIRESSDKTLLKLGNPYSLETIKNERTRIDQYVKEHGFINFNNDFLIIEVDTVTQKGAANLVVKIKPETPPESMQTYFVNDIFIYDDFALKDYDPDTIHFGRYHLVTQRKSLDFELFRRGVLFQPDQLYTRTSYTNSINYFKNIPLFKSTSFKLTPSPVENKLDANIYLTQKSRFSLSTEFDFITRTTNYFGPGVLASFTDRNLGRGAEQFKVNLTGRFEMQIAEGSINPAYQLGLEMNFSLPKLYPGFLEKRDLKRRANTDIGVGYNLFDRLDLYRLNSFFVNYGYKWRSGTKINHHLKLAEIIYSQVPEGSKTDAFREYLNQNPGVVRTFEEQFVVGSGYEFNYRSDKSRGKRHIFDFSGGIDLSGNLLRAILSGTGAQQDSLGRYRLLGLPFSQYIRTSVSAVYGYRFSSSNSLHTRLVMGYGQPYGNSDVIPYIKQFFVGGTNSLRSFIARSVGPGSEVPPDGFRDLTGDIRLELNAEYRFTFSGSFKGALFVDAGNVWLVNEDTSRLNGTFRSSTFLSEIAISSGWGLRWDFEFVVARLDFGYTLRTPFLPKGERWTKRVNLWDPVWNIAIGYPF